MKPQYTLFIIGDEVVTQSLNLNNQENNWIIKTSKLEEVNILTDDLIVDLNKLEIYSGFNHAFLAKLFDLQSLETIIQNVITFGLKAKDFDQSLALEMLGGSQLSYSNLLKSYWDNYHNVHEQFLASLQCQDYQTIRDIVHKIKGLSLYLGSEKLLEFAKTIEYKIYSNEITEQDIYQFINYHNRILYYVKEQVENVY